MELIRIALWAFAGFLVALTLFAVWKERSANRELGGVLSESIGALTDSELRAMSEMTDTGTVDAVVLPGRFQVMRTVGTEGDEYVAYEATTGERRTDAPTESEIQMLCLGQDMAFWADLRRYGQIAALVVLVVAILVEFDVFARVPS